MITIDFRHKSGETRFRARLIWQAMFDLYREHGGHLDKMDSLLCDYDILATHLLDKATVLCKPIYWSFSPDGFTDIGFGHFNDGEYVYSITITDDEAKIEG